VLRPDFGTNIIGENMCLRDMQQFSQNDAQIDALIAHFLNLKDKELLVNTTIKPWQPQNIISPTQIIL
jgi:hypothetical protein